MDRRTGRNSSPSRRTVTYAMPNVGRRDQCPCLRGRGRTRVGRRLGSGGGRGGCDGRALRPLGARGQLPLATQQCDRRQARSSSVSDAIRRARGRGFKRARPHRERASKQRRMARGARLVAERCRGRTCARRGADCRPTVRGIAAPYQRGRGPLHYPNNLIGSHELAGSTCALEAVREPRQVGVGPSWRDSWRIRRDGRRGRWARADGEVPKAHRLRLKKALVPSTAPPATPERTSKCEQSTP